MDNPFSIQERTEMIQAWSATNNHNDNITIIGIDDINDPPNWVKHATNHHGEGTLVTSDEGTKQLYEASDFPVVWVV